MNKKQCTKIIIKKKNRNAKLLIFIKIEIKSNFMYEVKIHLNLDVNKNQLNVAYVCQRKQISTMCHKRLNWW